MAIICVILIFYIIYDKLNFKIKLQRIAYTDNLTGANTIDKFVIDANKILCKNTQ
ncbi:putative diguanylate kinase signaling domain protein, partial [Clostridioides difficile DA00256]